MTYNQTGVHFVITNVGQAKSYPLKSKRPGKKTSNVTGAVHLQFSIVDPANPASTPLQVLQKLSAVVGTSASTPGDDGYGLEADDDEDDDDDQSPEPGTPGEADGTVETSEKKKRRLRIARLKNKAKQRGYEFTGTSSVAGVLFVEIQRITDLPPERNGELFSGFL
jgi:phosphatidylserine decarboxylase